MGLVLKHTRLPPVFSGARVETYPFTPVLSGARVEAYPFTPGA